MYESISLHVSFIFVEIESDHLTFVDTVVKNFVHTNYKIVVLDYLL